MLQVALNTKVKGNTLPEVLVAITLTSFCAALSVVIYLNIQQSTVPILRMKSNQLAAKYLIEALQTKNYFDDTYSEAEFRIKKRVSRNEQYSDCLDIKISVYNSDQKKLSELQTTIHDY